MEGKIFAVLMALLGIGAGLELKNGAYEDLVVSVSEAVPVKDCRIVLDNLEATLTSASQYLFSALNSRAYLRSATVLLPPSWPDSCASKSVVSGSGETPDVTVLPRGPARGRIYTLQSLGCGQPGDQIYLGYESLMHRDGSLARSFVKEFAKYRYGVFDEQGYYNDPVYPMCFYDDQDKQAKATGCSDLPIHDNGLCTSDADFEYNTTKMVDSRARSSIMFAAEAPSVSMFCDEGNHDRFAPTKHNSMCQRQSVLDVINKHDDFTSDNFINYYNNSQLIDTTPSFFYKKQNLTRYVFVLENTKDMSQRDSWNYLRLAVRYWALNILPDNTEVGMVLAEEASSKKALDIVSVKNKNFNFETSSRDLIYSAIPYTPGDSLQPGCLHCAIDNATDMLEERTRSSGAANNVILVIAPGMNPNEQLNKTLERVKKLSIKVATITYPTILRSQLLNQLAEETRGVAYTVFEQKYNVDETLLTTYFELKNVFYDVVQKFYSGSESNLATEIHRKEIKSNLDERQTSITGSFMLDPNMGRPSHFTLFTHNSITPLIKSIELISPSHQVFSTRNDKFIDFKMIYLTANISEPGTWTYVIKAFSGNPHPHFLQVMATPVSAVAPVVKARFWTHRNQPGGPLTLLVEVKRGEVPVLGAKVEVTVTKPEINGSYPYKNIFELLDTGAGDPDITKGDGVYSKYFSAGETGPGLYNFEVVVSDNGNTAYTWSESQRFDDDKPCCGSTISSSGHTPVSPFQRVLPKVTLMITADDITTADQVPAGRIGDLKVQVRPEDMRATLTWTSPDMGGHIATRYEIKYAETVRDITDNFDFKALQWEDKDMYMLAPGSDINFTLDMAQRRELLDKPLYFAIKSHSKFSDGNAPVSNWVRVLVPSPPPPPTVPPTYSSNEHTFWPNNNVHTVGVDPVSPSISKISVGLELILPIAIGFILLVILLILYCYFCVMKRRDHRDSHKKSTSNSPIKADKLSSTITIVPSCNQEVAQTQTTYTTDIPDPHQVGVPIQYDYEEETKKRYSLVNQQEQQLIEELKQQQMAHQHGATNNAYSGLSVISNSTLNRNGHTLSPYNSWSASQLLHEHERRHSPMEEEHHAQEMLINPHQQVDHMSLNGQSVDHMSLNGHHADPYQNQHHIPPPVPPLPAFNSNGYPVNYNIYGVHQGGQPIYQSMQRNENLVAFNPSLQGSLSSVNSGDKKRRNVTMV